MSPEERSTIVQEPAPAGTRQARRSGEARRAVSKVLILPPTLSVKHLSELTGQNAIDVIKQLMRHGIMASMNQGIDYQVAALVTTAFGIRTKMEEAAETLPTAAAKETEDEAKLAPRPPVVTILGHVDHGKTTLLDAIRRTRVAAREVGGITQHIGAYQVEYKGQKITFLDTPGHAAFTAIRARGARVTDIAVLVVAANDGIKPQTVEAIDHAKAANLPIIVVINKMDLPEADPEKVKGQLNQHGLLVEEWGGNVIGVPVSAKAGTGIDDLLENILVMAEIAELKANPDRLASGVIIEARLDRKRGPTATVLVQNGSLKLGDYIVAGTASGRVKAVTDDQGKAMRKVAPGAPGEILGFGSLPEAGDVLTVAPDERTARSLATDRERLKSAQQAQARSLTLEEVVNQISAGDIKELNLILKADVQGSVEAVRQSLEGLTDAEAKVRILHAGSGAVTESDVLLASASNGIIVGFTVGNEPSAERLADRLGVELRHYDIIYQLTEDVERALHGMVQPEAAEPVAQGKADIKEIFPSKHGVKIAGCRVVEGRITRGAAMRVFRKGQIIHETTLNSLRHFRDEVREVTSGMDCGMVLEGFNDFEVGDVLEAHRQERGRR